jgi:hypothetical protein
VARLNDRVRLPSSPLGPGKPGTTWVAALVLLVATAHAAPARADWLIIPFAGTAFGGEATASLDLDSGAGGAKGVYGVAATWLSPTVVGLEGEFLYGPGFFKNPNGNSLILSSHISTLSGGLLVTLPLNVTRESLRPYATAGFGFMDASVDYSVDNLFSDAPSGQFATFHVGGGAIGFVSPDVGFRFDLRHLTSLNRVPDELTNAPSSRLRFWRFTVGLALRIG